MTDPDHTIPADPELEPTPPPVEPTEAEKKPISDPQPNLAGGSGEEGP
jgi:hypothetical protein